MDELEAAGARIGKIRVVTQDIFDLEDPKENNWLFRLANRLHIQTRPEVIHRLKRVADHLRGTVAMIEADRPSLELALAVVMPDQVPPTAQTPGGRPDGRLHDPIPLDRIKA